MKLTKESTKGSIVQPQPQFPPPRYPNDLELIYLNHRVDFNLLNYLQLTIDEQLERTHHMFCGINDGWRVTFCGYNVDINLDP